jgi:hypothetical protein
MTQDSKTQIWAYIFLFFNYFIIYIFFPFVIILNIYILAIRILGYKNKTAVAISERIENILIIAIVIYLYLIVS